VRAHGGDITIENRPGLGCVFTIAIPLATTEESPVAIHV
jgi:signal transduction histidine kinase